MIETWKQIVGWPYEVSDHGRVRRSVRPRKGKGHSSVGFVLRPRMVFGKSTTPYACVVLVDGERRRRVFVHRLVLEAFIGSAPSAKHQCNHRNGRKLDNIPDNLEWATASENIRHAIVTGLNPVFPKNVKIGAANVPLVRARHANGESPAALAREFGVDWSTIKLLVTRKTWANIP